MIDSPFVSNDPFTSGFSAHPICRLDPDDWFAWPGSVKAIKAKQLCLQCPFMAPCRDYALTEGIPEGIFGGLDKQDREAVWFARGGKPSGFIDAIDAAVGPMLQARRDFEACNEWSETA